MSKVGVIQMSSQPSVEKNLAITTEAIEQAVQSGAQLILLPENFAFIGQQEKDKLAVAESFGEGPIQQFITELAEKYSVWIIAGTIPIKTGSADKIRAASLVFDDTGQCIARYDKIHLFDVTVGDEDRYFESEFIEPGNGTVVVHTPIGKVGLSVCYDLRFPELYRQLVSQEAEIIVIPSAFTMTTGQAHWRPLIRARAIENQCYVLAANQIGTHASQRVSYGHSMIINPWGEVLVTAESDTTVITAEVDLEYLRQLRERFPCLNFGTTEMA